MPTYNDLNTLIKNSDRSKINIKKSRGCNICTEKINNDVNINCLMFGLSSCMQPIWIHGLDNILNKQ